MKIYIFNPETDYALADFSEAYNPPQSVIELRAKNAFIQAPLCSPGDAILLLDNTPLSIRNNTPSTINNQQSTATPAASLSTLDSKIPTLRLSDLRPLFAKSSAGDISFQPWGWNPAIRRTLLRAGVPEHILPDIHYLKKLRMLSHRRNSILFNKILNDDFEKLPDAEFLISPLPNEFFDIDCAMDMYYDLKRENKEMVVKLPWSSAGRGVFFTKDINEERVRQWTSGVIRRQGSAICEVEADRKLDFATEWTVDVPGETPRFLGFSVFKTSQRGGYKGNVRAPQSQLIQIIKEAAPSFNPHTIVEIQRKALSKILFESDSPYKGYIGIDMLADDAGAIRACVEINFRCTMGVINLITDEETNMQSIQSK